MSSIVLASPPFRDLEASRGFWQRGQWPAHWIGHPEIDRPPLVLGFLLPVEIDVAQTVRLHVSADERYELFVDGERVGRGPERGDPNFWFFETYDLDLSAGTHTVFARVWALGEGKMPVAQWSCRPGSFLCAADNPELAAKFSTGDALWKAAIVPGYDFLHFGCAWGTGYNFKIDGATFPWGVETGDAGEWVDAKKLHVADDAVYRNDRIARHGLRPAMLPPQLAKPFAGGIVRHAEDIATDERTHLLPILADNSQEAIVSAWQSLLGDGNAVTVPVHTRRRILIDLDDYLCAYPNVKLRGGAGATVRIHWQEALFSSRKPWDKGHRDEIEGKFFTCMWNDVEGVGDTFVSGGSDEIRSFTPLWWQCGRFVEVLIETAGEPLEIHALTFVETRYPLENESKFESSDPKLGEIIPIMVRAMQMCAHETYFDCPFYEQLMYAGDTRLEVLTTYVMTRDDALPKKAIRMFDASRLTSGRTEGFTQSRYPAHILQMIPPFSLWWIGMVHDHLMWRGNEDLIREVLPGVRATLDAWLSSVDPKTGLIVAPPGWNYVDWVPNWNSGMPPGADVGGVSAIHNWHVVYTLKLAAAIEQAVGEPELAKRNLHHAVELAQRTHETFFDDARGIYADDLERTSYSEHAQCLALLGGLAPEDDRVYSGLVSDSNLARTTIYYSHYLFETFLVAGEPDRFLSRLELWHGLKAQGFRTTVEMPEPSRSDCHAWGAHPLFHYHASVAGIHPTSPGFQTVQIAPNLGSLTSVSSTIPHPNGEISVEISRDVDRLKGVVVLPEGVTGHFDWGQSISLGPGRNVIS